MSPLTREHQKATRLLAGRVASLCELELARRDSAAPHSAHARALPARFPRRAPHRERHRAQRLLRRCTGSQAAATVVAARLPADARDLAQGRATPALAVHARDAGPARLRRFRQAGRTTRPFGLQQAHHGPRRADADARARPRRVSRLRPRPRRPRRTPARPRSSANGPQARTARHLADACDVRTNDDGVRAQLLPLVLPDSTRSAAGAAHRRRAVVLSAHQARRLGLRRLGTVRRARTRGVRTLLRGPGRDSRDVRGLPRGSDDRSHARPRGCCAAHRLPGARAVGRARRRRATVHAARGLASQVLERGHRPRTTDGPLHSRGTAGPARRRARSILCNRLTAKRYSRALPACRLSGTATKLKGNPPCATKTISKRTSRNTFAPGASRAATSAASRPVPAWR